MKPYVPKHPEEQPLMCCEICFKEMLRSKLHGHGKYERICFSCWLKEKEKEGISEEEKQEVITADE